MHHGGTEITEITEKPFADRLRSKRKKMARGKRSVALGEIPNKTWSPL
jgi:hypothetical protein